MFDNAPTISDRSLNLVDEEQTNRLNALKVEELSPTERLMAQAKQVPNGNCIAFYLPKRSEALKIWNQDMITLGRGDKRRKIVPTIDLNEQDGAYLGVSRLHARISYKAGSYFVQDLNSTNGTWVNGRRLEPQQEMLLKYGDSLRLGHLMIQIGS